MKPISLLSQLSVLVFSLSASAFASWTAPASAGTIVGIGNPSCAAASTGLVACAVRTGKSAITVSHFNGTTWAAWATQAGTVSSDPSCTNNGAASVLCAATSTTGGLQVTTFDGTSWNAPTIVAGALYSAPSCASTAASDVLCVARNATGGLSWTLFNGTTWSAFKSLTPKAVSAPSCTSNGAGDVICSVFVTTGTTSVNRFRAGSWTTFLNIGGTAGGTPDCASLNSSGKVICLAKAYDSGIYASEFNGGSWAATNWTPYGGLSGTVNDNASCASHVAGQMVCGATAVTDNAFYDNVFSGSAWSGWFKVGGSGVGSPSCAPLGSSKVVCLFMGPNNKLSSTVGP